MSDSHSDRGPRRICDGIGLFDAVAGLHNDVLGHGHDGDLRGSAVALQSPQRVFCFCQFADNAGLHPANVAVVTVQEDIIQLQRQRVCSLRGGN